MVEAERTTCKNISLYPRQINAVKNYANYKEYKGESEAYQKIIDDFFNNNDEKNKTDFILFLAIPILFCILTTIVNLSTGKVYNILLEQGLYFNELNVLSNAFTILSFTSIGIFIACIYWYRKKYIEYKELSGVLDGN